MRRRYMMSGPLAGIAVLGAVLLSLAIIRAMVR
jgi:hypothetical protein